MLETSQAKTTYDAKNELIRETWENMEKMTINEQEEEVGLMTLFSYLFY